MGRWSSKKVSDDEYRQRIAKLYRVDESGCWLWTSRFQAWGYGYFSYRGDNAAHRVMYRLTKGQIPKGMRICHTCDVRACVNPDHLWLGTQQENIKDCSEKKRHTNGAKTHCPRGHEYTPENTLMTDAGKGRWRRSCKACNRIRQRLASGWSAERAQLPPPADARERALRSWATRRGVDLLK